MSAFCVSTLTIVVVITAVCQAEVTSFPEYEYDDLNSTLRYSFFSNTSSEDLDEFLKNRTHLLDSQEDDNEDQAWVTTGTPPTRGGGVTDMAVSLNSAPSVIMMMTTMMMMVVVMEIHT
ncbi:uncharacterized protein LOC144067250 [Stigmatopora argus]